MEARVRTEKSWQAIAQAGVIVVKVGTSTLIRPSGAIDYNTIDDLVRQLAQIKRHGRQVVLVTSGAIGVGMGRLGLGKRPREIPARQALAAIGQGILMQTYEQMFDAQGVLVAQVLLTKDDVADRVRYLNARNTLNTILEYGAIPIINENDTVTFDEIKVGDNDTLAAMVAGLIDADLLVLLSDIDGFYDCDPRQHDEAQRIPVVDRITPEIEALAGAPGTYLGSGGMRTKLDAARIATSQGIPMVLTRGGRADSLDFLLDQQEPACGTLFLPAVARLEKRKCWLAFNTRPQGRIQVDDGAAQALRDHGKSLLPSGILEARGQFQRGSVVTVEHQGRELARGISNYSRDELERIIGRHSREIATILGEGHEPEVIHRNNLSLMR